MRHWGRGGIVSFHLRWNTIPLSLCFFWILIRTVLSLYVWEMTAEEPPIFLPLSRCIRCLFMVGLEFAFRCNHSKQDNSRSCQVAYDSPPGNVFVHKTVQRLPCLAGESRCNSKGWHFVVEELCHWQGQLHHGTNSYEFLFHLGILHS